MSQFKRARSAESREVRRTQILAAARDCFERSAFASVTMDHVAKQAHLAKGTLFLYFATKEALFLDLLDVLMHEWMNVLHETAAQDGKPWNSRLLAGVVVDTLAARPVLGRLLPLGASVLERNVPAGKVAEYKHRLLRRLFSTGSVIEQRLGLARAGDGVQLLVFGIAMIVGLQLSREPAGADTDLRTALTVLFNGFHRK